MPSAKARLLYDVFNSSFCPPSWMVTSAASSARSCWSCVRISSETVVRSRPERFAETTAARCERMRRTSLGPRPTATSAMDPRRIGTPRGPLFTTGGGGGAVGARAACWPALPAVLSLLVLRRGCLRRFQAAVCLLLRNVDQQVLDAFDGVALALVGADQDLDLLVVFAVPGCDVAANLAADRVRHLVFIEPDAREFFAIEPHLDLGIARVRCWFGYRSGRGCSAAAR